MLGETDQTVQQMVDEGVRQAYNNPDNPLRASVLMDPAGKRINTKDNTPADLFTLIWFLATKLKFKSQPKAAVLRTKLRWLY
ncbi:fumarate hydratase [Vibrio lentus]|nr:fumarate hydratase [Vibrio lentus]